MIPPRSKNRNYKDVSSEKFEQREAWYKLVVKIIGWKDGLNTPPNKITPQEWNTYCDQMIQTNSLSGHEKISLRLNETRKMIKANGGFEDNSL